jgi:hypothetical protein
MLLGHAKGEGASRAKGGRLFVEYYPVAGFPLYDVFNFMSSLNASSCSLYAFNSSLISPISSSLMRRDPVRFSCQGFRSLQDAPCGNRPPGRSMREPSDDRLYPAAKRKDHIGSPQAARADAGSAPSRKRSSASQMIFFFETLMLSNSRPAIFKSTLVDQREIVSHVSRRFAIPPSLSSSYKHARRCRTPLSRRTVRIFTTSKPLSPRAIEIWS